jgi:hypothetical protein
MITLCIRTASSHAVNSNELLRGGWLQGALTVSGLLLLLFWTRHADTRSLDNTTFSLPLRSWVRWTVGPRYDSILMSLLSGDFLLSLSFPLGLHPKKSRLTDHEMFWHWVTSIADWSRNVLVFSDFYSWLITKCFGIDFYSWLMTKCFGIEWPL